ncbi:MAG: WecB/TagA/CpsF family glycosyltransferase [Oscillospiraceae bacterium]|nr:WecB/TagA/CpsF family glycosyltransferase [Oscillospiraceae bacterium]
MHCEILGVKFDNVTMDEALARALSFLDGASPGGAVRARLVMTPNAEIVMRCRRDAEAHGAVCAADLALPDGVGVVIASRILGRPLRERMAGIDFAEALLPALAARGHRLFLLGGAPGVAEEAARRAAARHAGLAVCGTRDGYFTRDGDAVAAVRAAGADVVFVCLGAPKQELWMRAHAAATGARLLVGLGGTLDVWAGRVRRAPALWTRLGLEWLYRLLCQPRRLWRMLKLPKFLWAAWRARGEEKRVKNKQ